MGTLVALGEKANIFHDQSSGITINKGEKVELSKAQLNNKRIKAALAGGHLQYTTADEEKPSKVKVAEPVEIDPEKLKAAFITMVTEGKTEKVVAKAFNMAKLKVIAEEFNIDVEADDTKEDIVKVLFEELQETEE